MLSTSFINSEMLAECYIANISTLKTLLEQGKTSECLSLVQQLEHDMLITLAIGELADLDRTQ